MRPDPASVPPGPYVRLYSSWRGLLGAVVSPLLLLGLGGSALRAGGPRTFPLALVLLGGALLLVTVLDYPSSVRFDTDGITRVAALRTERVSWDRLVAVERTRPATAAAIRSLTDRHGGSQISGGLVARGRGRRRWLLTDRVESRMEYDRLARLLAGLGDPVHLRAARPHAEATPTFLYRRRDPGGSPAR